MEHCKTVKSFPDVGTVASLTNFTVVQFFPIPLSVVWVHARCFTANVA